MVSIVSYHNNNNYYYKYIDLYKICLRRCTERLELAEQRDRSGEYIIYLLLLLLLLLIDSSLSVKSLSREGSVEVIHLDVQRTFPTLGFFQEVWTFSQIPLFYSLFNRVVLITQP